MSTDPQTRSWWNRVFGGAPNQTEEPSSESTEIADADDLVELIPDATELAQSAVEPPSLEPPSGNDGALRERLAHAEQRAETDRVRAASLERDYEHLLEAHAQLERRAQNADELVATLRQAAEAAEHSALELRKELAEAAGKNDEAHKAKRALADRDKRLRSQAAELSTLRIAHRKANDTERDLRRELTELAERTTRGIDDLELAVAEARRAQAAAEAAREADAAQLAELRIATAKSEAAHRAISAETSQLRREQSVTQRTCREATEAATQAREQLAAALRDKTEIEAKYTEAQRKLEQLRTHDARSSTQLDMVRAFATHVISIGAASLRECVGDRAALPLARSWRRHPPSVPLGSRTVADPKELVADLSEHLRELGIVSADGRTTGTGLILDCTMTGDSSGRPPGPPGDDDPALWVAEYIRAWLHAAHGRDFAVTGIRAGDEGRTFSVTLE